MQTCESTPGRTLRKAALLGGAAAGAYALFVRPWHLRWGSTDQELKESLPGDDVLKAASQQVTHAITIARPAEQIWPWLIQIGQDRGGFYSYSWLENLFGLHVKNVSRIMPRLQDLKVGDFIRATPPQWLNGRFEGLAGWHVVDLQPSHALVLQSPIDQSTWSFVLKPIGDNATRLIARVRAPAPTRWSLTAFNYLVGEPAHFLMERKMLLTLKQLAEAADSRLLVH